MTQNMAEKKPFSFHWGWRIATIYTAFALATLGFMFFSLTQKVDLVSNDYYKAELAFDKNIEAKNNTASLSKDIQFQVLSNQLLIQYPITPDKATLTFYRPSSSAFDKNQQLQSDVNQETISIAALQAGLWIAKIDWSSEGKNYYSEYRFTK